MTLTIVFILISSVSFFYYGIAALTTQSMIAEFQRYGLKKMRLLTAYLQLLGAIGICVGLYNNVILLISAGGLSLLMLIGFGVRVKMRDGFWLSMPSFLFMLLNLYIFVEALHIKQILR